MIQPDHKRRCRLQLPKREWESISLIDVIMLMLIFAFMIPGGRHSGIEDGPEGKTLRIRMSPVVAAGDVRSQTLVVTSPYTGETTIRYVFNEEFQDANAVAFAGLSPSQDIAQAISEFLRDRLAALDVKEPIQIAPTDDTPFKIVDFLVRQTSLLGDSVLVVIPEAGAGGGLP
jgi:hypothetical protein